MQIGPGGDVTVSKIKILLRAFSFTSLTADAVMTHCQREHCFVSAMAVCRCHAPQWHGRLWDMLSNVVLTNQTAHLTSI